MAIWEMRLATAGCANAHDRGMPGSENVSVSDRITMRFECSSIMVAVDSPPNVRSMPPAVDDHPMRRLAGNPAAFAAPSSRLVGRRGWRAWPHRRIVQCVRTACGSGTTSHQGREPPRCDGRRFPGIAHRRRERYGHSRIVGRTSSPRQLARVRSPMPDGYAIGVYAVAFRQQLGESGLAPCVLLPA